MSKCSGVSMFNFSGVSLIGLMMGVLGAGCDPANDPAGDEESTGASGGSSEGSDSGDSEAVVGGAADGVWISEPPEALEAGLRSCTKQNDCLEVCDCSQGKCVPDGFGPPPPADLCDQAPTRACSSAADCQSGCKCTGGKCKDDGIGAVNPSCHLPPPDAFEVDDTWTKWKAYGGPQIHNFHHTGDEDWVMVYFATAGKVNVRTMNLRWGTDTYLEVYKFLTSPKPNGALGPRVGFSDDIGGQWFDPDSKASRVDVTVAAGSAYLIRVVNKTSQSTFDGMYDLPTYTLNMWYL